MKDIVPINSIISGNYYNHKIRIKDKNFNSKSINKILSHFKFLEQEKIKNSKIKIIIDSNIIQDDGISYILYSYSL